MNITSLSHIQPMSSPKSACLKSFIRSPLSKCHSSLKAVTGEENSEELMMKKRFSKLTEKQTAIMLDKTIDILSKPSEKRTLDEIFHLLRATEKLDFFARMKKGKEGECFNPSSMSFKCCKALKHEYFEKGETVFLQGDVGDKFYIIIKGKVGVLLLKDPATIKKEKDVLRSLRRNRVIPEYMKKFQNLTENKIEESAGFSNSRERAHTLDPNLERGFKNKASDSENIKKRFQKGISKVSNALLFLKTIEKSSENSKNQASLTAFASSRLELPGELSKDICSVKEPDNPIRSGTIIGTTNAACKKSPIPGLDLRDLKAKDVFVEDGVFKYNHIQTLKAGDVFGELAIIRRKKRAATVVCAENTHLAILMKKDYESILLEQETVKFQKLVDFFNRTLFRRCSNDRMTSIAYLYQKRKYVKDQLIFKEGQEPTECFIVKKGDVEISKTLFEYVGKTREGKPVKQSKKGKVAILSEGQFFGEEEILRKSQTRNYTAQVNSVKATLYYITKQNFKKMLGEYKDIAELFTKQVNYKELFHSGKISQISSLHNLEFKLPCKTLRKSKAPLRATLSQLDFFFSENKSDLQSHTLPSQTTSQNLKQAPAIRTPHDENLTEKQLYHQETHQFSSLVRANQSTLKALLKKKINIFELYSKTKNLHNPNEIKYRTRRERAKTQGSLLEQKSSIIHSPVTLQNFEKKGDKSTEGDEFLSVFTPIRRVSNSKATVLYSPSHKTNFIKTYEYFYDPKVRLKTAEITTSRASVASLPEESLLKPQRQSNSGFCVRNNSCLGLNEMIERKSDSFRYLEDERKAQTNSIVVLNHMGKPLKISQE